MAGKTKTRGQIFTPPRLVEVILDYLGYTSGNILRRHIIDNSCGDGAFLREIVRRYIADYRQAGGTEECLHKELATYIHGVEVELDTWRECMAGLNAIIDGVQWDVRCADALAVRDYDGQMDYVVGNPPYVRVHNLDNYDDVKRYRFAAEGMTDLYIVFFELGFLLLKPTGRMAIITPSSWLGSKAAAVMRRDILRRRNLSGLIDLGHYQPFNATTYTIISRFEGSAAKPAAIDYQTYDGQTHAVGCLTLDDIYIDGAFFVGTSDALGRLRDIREHITARQAIVKNGFATLADSVFIADGLPDEPCRIDIVKASTGRWTKCIFPYDNTAKPVTLDYLRHNCPQTFQYLVDRKEKLCARDAETDDWHLFGRSQAIRDVYKDKIAINTLLRNARDIKLCQAGKGTGVYSGLYILSPLPFDDIRRLLCTDEFAEYIAMLKNYKSGGYYTFSSRDLELFLNYKLATYASTKLKVS